MTHKINSQRLQSYYNIVQWNGSIRASHRSETGRKTRAVHY